MERVGHVKVPDFICTIMMETCRDDYGEVNGNHRLIVLEHDMTGDPRTLRGVASVKEYVEWDPKDRKQAKFARSFVKDLADEGSIWLEIRAIQEVRTFHRFADWEEAWNWAEAGRLARTIERRVQEEHDLMLSEEETRNREWFSLNNQPY